MDEFKEQGYKQKPARSGEAINQTDIIKILSVCQIQSNVDWGALKQS